MGIDANKVLSLLNQKKETREERILRLLAEKRAQQGGTATVVSSVPEATAAKEDNDRFFKAGAFSDGYQFGDITKTILGTAGDIGVNAVKGAGSLVEGVTDLLGYAGAGIADLFGADEFANDWKKSIQKNTVDAIFKGAEDFVDKSSVLGGRSDAISQGLGQVAAIILTGGAAGASLGATGATALTTAVTGLSGMGSGMSQAYQEGATDGEAVAYGAIAGTAEALTEWIFAGMGKSVKALGFGKGLSSADDILAKKLSSKISSQLGKNLVELGVKAGAEGTEEVLSGVAQAFGKKLTYMSEEDLGKIIKDERLFDQFLTGAITSGIAQSGIVPGMKVGSFREATKAGRDMITGLTQNEQKVVDKVVADRVAERKKSGELSKKQEAEIYDKVLEDMENGRISIDTIESVLGGDTYKGYQDAVAQESKLKKEIEALESLPDNAITVKQRERLAEARKQLEGLDTQTAKSNLFSKVDKLTANDTNLRESYNERTRRGQAFTADLTKYDAKQQETVKRAIESGILNNTNRTHEFVDLIAKISANKGVSFNFADNAKLKESGFAIDGKQVNGFVTADGVTININSAKALNSVVGHEITHVLEGTDLYNELQSAIVEYAKSKGDYQGRYDTLTELYKDVEGADIDAELTADLVGDYLFTDADFVKRLSTEHRSVFQKLFDEIKHLCKLATAGTKEARELEKVKKLFEDAYRTETKNPTNDGGVRYSIDERFKSLVDNWDGETVGFSFVVGETSVALQEAGVPKKQIRWDASKIKTLLGKHSGMTLETVKQIPELLENPIVVIDSKKSSNSKIVMGDLYDENGHIVTAVILLTPTSKKGNVLDVLKISSAEGRSHINSLFAYEDGTPVAIRYIDKKRIQSWLNVNRLQLPLHNLDLDSNTIIDGSDPVVKEEKSPNTKMRDVFGFAVNKDANVNEDLLEELSIHDPNAEVDADGNVTVYHRTTAENADSIRRTGIMKAQEDALFFSSKDSGYVSDYGDTVIKLKIPSTVLQVNDIFDGEVHFDIPLKYKNGGFRLDVSRYLQATKEPSKIYSLSGNEQTAAPAGGYRITGEDIALAPTKEDIAAQEIATAPAALRNDVDAEELGAPTREDILQMEMERELYGDWRMTDPLDIKVEKLYRMMLREQISEDDYNAQLVKADRQYQQRGSRVEDALERIRQAYSTHQAATADESAVEREEVEAVLGEKGAYVSKQANALYDEVKGMQKGKRVSNTLSYLLDTLDLSEEHKAESYNSLRTALLNIRDNPDQVVNPNSAVEAAAREMLGREYDAMVEEFANAEGVAKSIYAKMESLRTELENNQSLREQANADFDDEIARLQAEYEAKKNKNTKVANDILRRIERTQSLKSQVDADYGKRIDRLGEQLEKMNKPEYKTAMQRKAKTEEYTNLMAELVGDTSTWVDKKLGLSYSINTLRRNLRDIVRDSKGNRDIAKADAIYDELQGKYNHNEAELKRESLRIKEVFQELGLNHAEDTYAHMLGEFQYNPDSKLSQERLEEYYEKNKDKIDTKKVDKAIAEARKVFDDLIVRVNERLKEQGMKQIPYRKGYFPHFTNPKQTWLHKFFNWKPVDNEIPTSIAGLTEEFNPQRSWQSFDKQRISDDTDYSLEQGLDTYIHGALDWIYHIEDIQKRRALENYIRYVHSDEGIKKRIDEIRNNESYDADEAQELIDAVYAEAKNPLNNFVSDLRTGTNTLANKKSSLDRKAEEMTNRKIYSVMTNLNSRINANMVVGSFSSALTNFIPITQSWLEVSPVYSLKGMRDTIKSTFRNDGVVNKSDFLTNRLMNEEKLYQTGWDKVSEKAGLMMEAIDSFTSQTVWRSKYHQNIAEGMSETEAIKNADQFAENVIAGRSRGNQPTIFDAKNPLTKIFTAFQLEVANQYGYMFKDAPQDAKNKGRLIKGYATAFLGAYAYNALYSSLVGRDAAFDPLSILEDLFRDLFGDDEEEPEEAFLNLADNVLEEVPFVGGLMGGGRVPISSAIPYEGDYKTFITDLANGELSAKEMLKPIYYLAMPVAGGQIKKTNEGLKMFDEDLPVAGSYTDSGNLRFPVEEDSIADWLQAALFGQYASKNAREYFDNGWAPLKEKQIEEFASLEIPVADYREIRKQLGKLGTIGEKLAYIHTLDLPVSKKNILANNLTNREEPIDMAEWGNLDEFDYAVKYPEKAQFLIANGVSVVEYNSFDDETKAAYDWAYLNPEKYAVSKTVTDDIVTYRTYTKALSEIKADKDSAGKTVSGSRKKKVVQYINGLDAEYGAKLVLYKLEYPSDDTYNGKIIEYVNGIEGFTFEQKANVLGELGFTVAADGRVLWN